MKTIICKINVAESRWKAELNLEGGTVETMANVQCHAV